MSDSLDRDGFPSPKDDFGVQNPFVSPVAQAQGEGYVTPPAEPLIPWVSMWTKPRATVRQQLDTDPEHRVLLLAAVAGAVGWASNTFIVLPEEISHRVISLFSSMLVGAIFAIASFFPWAWVAGFVGRSLGGVAMARECRTAIAWSFVPGIWMAPMNLAIGLYFVVAGRDALPQQQQPRFVPVQEVVVEPMPTWMILWFTIVFAVGLWQFIITCRSVGEAHQFSSMRGLGTLLLSTLVMMGVAFVFAIAFMIVVAVAAMTI